MRFKKKWGRRFLLTAVGSIVAAQIIALSPSPLEETTTLSRALEANSFIQDSSPTLAPGIPTQRIAEYSIEKFHYVSIQNGIKQWRIEADTAFLYHPEHLVHGRTIKAYLYDSENKITTVTGDEAKYFMHEKDLEIYGNIRTYFPDGFEIDSDYLHYRPKDQLIEIPTSYLTTGFGDEKASQILRFKSNGLKYWMGPSEIELLAKVTVTFERQSLEIIAQPLQKTKLKDITQITSDRCLIHRNESLAQFSMNNEQPSASGFVHMTQPTLFAKSRRATLNYGDHSQVLHYLSAEEDVLIEEIDQKSQSSRYATGGRAKFDERNQLIVLTEFPQVYSDEDTATGSLILLHRDTGIVEIEHSNAFSEGIKN